MRTRNSTRILSNPDWRYTGGDYTTTSEANCVRDHKIDERVTVGTIKLNNAIMCVYDDVLDALTIGTRTDRKVVRCEVFVYSTELNPQSHANSCRIGDINHALIRITDERGRQHTLEWGVVTTLDDRCSVYHNPSEYYYGYDSPDVHWFGARVLNIPVNNNVNLVDFARHSALWNDKFGKGGVYPRNCRGYVDSVLHDLLDVGTLRWNIV